MPQLHTHSHTYTLLYLVLAIAFEVAWALCLKASNGFARRDLAAATIVTYALSLLFLMLAVRDLQVGTTYAIWAGSGAALIAIFGVLLFKEPVTTLKIASLALVIAGVIGLNLADNHPARPANRDAPTAK